MRIAINGAGIVRPTLAWLHHNGHEPTMIEKAPHFRGNDILADEVACRM